MILRIATRGPIQRTFRALLALLFSFVVVYSPPVALAAPAPTITSISPSYGPPGTSVTINGANYGTSWDPAADWVTFGGVTAVTYTSWTATRIVCLVPAGAVQGNVVVTKAKKTSNGVAFTPWNPPVLSAVTPNPARLGASVSVIGTGFGATKGTSAVTFAGVTAATTSWSNTLIVATVPTLTAGNVVVNRGGLLSGGVAFTPLPPPSISSLSASTAEVGTNITVYGAAFGSAQGTGTVTFGGVSATVVSWANTQITARVPGSGPVVVTQDSVASNGYPFTAWIAPRIDALSATTAPVGSAIVITGAEFGSSQGTSTVTFSGVPATVIAWAAGSISVVVPSAPPGNVVVTRDGHPSNGVGFAPVPPPYIDALSASSARIGANIVITGSGFGATQGASSVTFNGFGASVVSWSSSAITVTVPNSTAGDVVVDCGGILSNGVAFTPIPPPQISSLSAASGEIGSPLTVNGTDFGAIQGAGTVSFNGAPATVTSWSDTQIEVLICGSGPVVVAQDGFSSNGAAFFAYVVPEITSLSATSAYMGTNITISGNGFGSTQGTSTVSFNGTSAEVVSWSSTAIVVTVPNVGAGDVVVTVSGYPSNGVAFTPIPAPYISALSTATGAIGTPIVVSGANFGASQGLGVATFNGVPATVLIWTDTAITVVVPGSGPIVVFQGGAFSNAVAFTAFAAPQIDSLSASSARVGTNVTVNGTSFGAIKGASTVTFNGTNASVVSWSDTAITVTVPSATAGDVKVNRGGVWSNGIAFTPIPPPQISSLSTTTAEVGTAIVVNGTSFGAIQGLGTVTFNGTPGTVVIWTDTAITVAVPCSGPVVVNQDGVASNGMALSAYVRPQISSLSDDSAYMGTNITISGTDFGSTQGTSTVTFAGVNASVVSWSGTAITVSIPSAPAGNVVVTVGGRASNGIWFTPVPAPYISSLSATSAEIGMPLTIYGANFGSVQGAGNVTFNGTPGTVNSWTDTSITVVVPDSGPVVVIQEGVFSNGVPLSLYVSPRISSLSATSAYMGTGITISGTDFGATQGASTVTFNGTNASVVSWSGTAITVTVPNAGAGAVVVTVEGHPSNGVTFTPVPAPYISSLSATSAEIGSPLTVHGANFGASRGVGNVTFNGVNATVTAWSDASIDVVVPGTGPVLVSQGGSSSNSIAFSGYVSPKITSLSSSKARIGTNITLTGTTFGWSQGASTVTLGGTVCAVVSWTNTAITVTVPNAPSGNLVVTVDGHPSNGMAFQVVPAPVVTSLSAASAMVGASITVYGTDFGASRGSGTVTFNGTSSSVVVWTDTAITVVVPGSGPVVVTADGLPSNALAFTSYVVPAISSVSPGTARVGAAVTISGTAFGASQGSSTVTFNGTFASVTSWSDTAITAAVPGPGPVVVSVDGRASNAAAFTAIPAPAIGSLSAASAELGTAITVSGTDFGAAQGLSTVTFNGVPATVLVWSNTAVTVVTPGNGPVVVTCDGIASNAAAFTSYVSPQITSVVSNPARTGTAVTISGTVFGSSQGGSSVTFNGVAASVTTWSDTAITATVPGPGPVVVTVDGHASNAVAFTAIPAPAIGSLSAASAEIGTAITVSGTDFGAAQGLSTVTFDGVPATVLVWSNTAVTVVVPGNGPVVVTCDGIGSNAAAFSAYVSPQIASLSASSARIGTQITITGTNFGSTQGASTVAFNGTAATVVSWSATAIAVAVPNATAGDVVVTVGGHASNGVAFVPVPAPFIAGISPATAEVGAGVTVSGSDFGAVQGASTITFNGAPATVLSWSDVAIVCSVPGNGPVVVTADGLASNAVAFSAYNLPHIVSLSASSARIGTQITITGTDFGSTQGASTVAFNGTAATVVSWSATAIAVAVPNATAGGVVVTVGGHASNGVAFVPVPAPHIASLSATSAELGSQITVTGTDFGATQGASTVTFNGTTATVVSWSDTSIVVVVPGNGPVVVSAGGTASNGVAFAAYVSPRIDSLSATSAKMGTDIQITGTDFGSTQGASTVAFNGTAAIVISWSTTAITVTVPNTTAGDVVVTVGGRASNGVAFTPIPAPYITSLSASSAEIGTSITVIGSQFGALQGTVRFNGVPATVLAWSDTMIAVVVPGSGPVVVTAGGVSSNGVAFTAYRLPRIDSAPGSARVGTDITITGAYFGTSQGASTVSFAGTAADVVSWSPTAIGVTVPDVGPGDLVVTVGGRASNAVAFAPIPAPHISSLSSPSAEIGTAITVFGSDFGAAQGGGSVTFGGVAGTVVSWSDLAIAVTVPRSGPVVVNADGFSSNGVAFTAYRLPRIDSAPGSARVGTDITITGAYFGTSQGASTVSFAGTAADVVSWSPTAICVTVPDVGPGDLVVTVGGRVSNAVAFAPVPAPCISGVSTAVAEIGTQITITGTDFGDLQGSSSIFFTGVAAPVVSWSNTAIVVTVPSSGPIMVMADGVASNQVAFRAVLVPVVTSLSSCFATVGDTVTIYGRNFGSTGQVVVAGVPVPHSTWSSTQVTFKVPGFAQGYVGVRSDGYTSNGIYSTHSPRIDSVSSWWAQPGSTVSVVGRGFGNGSDGYVTIAGERATTAAWSDTVITVNVPANGSSGLVAVTRGAWAVSNAKHLVVTVQARLDSVSATSVLPGQTLTLSGSSFGAADPASKVLIGGTLECPVVSWSATSVQVTVPDSVTSGYIGVWKQGVSSNGLWIQRSLVKPVVTALSSSWGAPGTQITITGTGFGSAQGAGYPVFAGTRATVVTWSDTSVVAVVPDGAETGYVGIMQNNTVSNGKYFVPAQPPVISTCSTGTASIGARVTITGTGFGTTQGGGRLTLAGVTVTPASWSDTSIAFDVPAGSVSGYIGVTHHGWTSNGKWLTVVP